MRKQDTPWADTLVLPYRSEAFAEDLDDLESRFEAPPRVRLGAPLQIGLFALPLVLALVGSVSALALT